MKKLFINTQVAKKAVVSLLDETANVIDQVEDSEPLVAVDKLLKKTGVRLADIDEISSHPGPGSYTGLRVGAAVAGALNFALGKKTKPPEIKYE